MKVYQLPGRDPRTLLQPAGARSSPKFAGATPRVEEPSYDGTMASGKTRDFFRLWIENTCLQALFLMAAGRTSFLEWPRFWVVLLGLGLPSAWHRARSRVPRSHPVPSRELWEKPLTFSVLTGVELFGILALPALSGARDFWSETLGLGHEVLFPLWLGALFLLGFRTLGLATELALARMHWVLEARQGLAPGDPPRLVLATLVGVFLFLSERTLHSQALPFGLLRAQIQKVTQGPRASARTLRTLLSGAQASPGQSPWLDSLLYRLGRIEGEDLGDLPAAAETFARLRRDFPQSAWVDDSLAREAQLEIGNGNLAVAEEKLEALKRLRPRSPRIAPLCFALSRAYREEGRFEKARAAIAPLESSGGVLLDQGSGSARLEAVSERAKIEGKWLQSLEDRARPGPAPSPAP